MTFIETPNTARVAVTMVNNLHPIVNTLWFRKATPYALTDLQDLAGEISTFWDTQVMPNLCTQTALTQVYALDASSETGPVFTLPVSPPQAGSDPDTPLALNCAMTVTFQTSTRGRSGRGRIYLSGFSEGAANYANWSSGAISGINTAFEDLPLYLTGSGSTHVVASHYTNGAPRATGVTYPVIGYRANGTVYSQRNRTR